MSSMPWKEWTWPDNEPISSREETSSYWLWVVQLTLQHQFTDVEPKRSEQIWRDSWEVSNLHFLWAVLKLLTVRLQGTATVSSIPQTYADYADVFSSLKQNVSAHEKHDYVIDNNEKNPSHSLLYNLSDKKLQVLQSYLNDTLVKGWIQHSVSLTGRQCYSPQRKTVACDCVLTIMS
jgi:hypothetical protein